MTENVGPNDIIGKTSSSQTKKFCTEGYERKSMVSPTIFQLFEQQIINPENTQLIRFHDLPILDVCLVTDKTGFSSKVILLVVFFLR